MEKPIDKGGRAAHRRVGFYVHVDRPAADCATLRVGGPDLAQTGQKRSHKEETGAHLGCQGCREIGGIQMGRFYTDSALASVDLDFAAEVGHYLQHHLYVADPGNLMEYAWLLGEERAGKQRQNGVFRTANSDFTGEPAAAINYEPLH